MAENVKGSMAVTFPWTDGVEAAWVEWDSERDCFTLRELVIVERDGYDVWDGDDRSRLLHPNFADSIVAALDDLRPEGPKITCSSSDQELLLKRLAEEVNSRDRGMPETVTINGRLYLWENDEYLAEDEM